MFVIFSILQITTSAAKKLWEKSGVADMKMPSGGSLAPLQLHGGPEHQVWRDSTWSTQGEGILPAPRRSFPHQQDNNQSTGILRYSFFFFKIAFSNDCFEQPP